MRVLRPAISAVGTGTVAGSPSEEQPAQKADVIAIDSADANAIEEVNVAYDNVKEVDCLDVTKEGTDAWDAAVKRCYLNIDFMTRAICWGLASRYVCQRHTHTR